MRLYCIEHGLYTSTVNSAQLERREEGERGCMNSPKTHNTGKTDDVTIRKYVIDLGRTVTIILAVCMIKSFLNLAYLLVLIATYRLASFKHRRATTSMAVRSKVATRRTFEQLGVLTQAVVNAALCLTDITLIARQRNFVDNSGHTFCELLSMLNAIFVLHSPVLFI